MNENAKYTVSFKTTDACKAFVGVFYDGKDGYGILSVDDFSLTLAPAGYAVPVIVISASESEVYTGNTIDITSLVTSESAISKVVYTVDGETFEKTDASDNYKLSLQKEAGTYEVKAYAVDSLLGRSLE